MGPNWVPAPRSGVFFLVGQLLFYKSTLGEYLGAFGILFLLNFAIQAVRGRGKPLSMRHCRSEGLAY